MADQYTPQKSDRFTFGLWTVGAVGRDPFGEPVRAPLSPVYSVQKLAELGAYGVNLHDNDLVPFDATPAERDRIVREFKGALAETGLVVPEATTNLFTHPIFRDGAFTASDAAVRAFALQKTMRAIDLGAELGAKLYVFWGGREGSETDVYRDPQDAIKHLREAINFLCDYANAQGYGMRFALEPKPNEPRGDSYLPTVGHMLHFITTLDHPEMVGVNPEFAHETMAGLNFVHAVAQALEAGKLFHIDINDQIMGRYDQDFRFAAENPKRNGNLPAGWAYVPLEQVMRKPNYKDFSPRIGLAYAVARNVSVRAGYGIFFTPTSNNAFNNQGTDGNPFFFDFTINGDTQNPVLLTSGFPSSGINSVLGSTSFGAYYGPLNRPDPYSQKYSFNVEWAPKPSLLLDLGYVGQRSLHFPTLELGNQAQPGPTPLVQRLPYPNVGTFYFYVPAAISQYHGMTASVTANNWHNVVMKSAFTYSKALGYNTASDASITDRFNLNYDYGPIEFDIKYRWVTSFVYRIPTSRSLPKAARAVIGNWDASGVLTVQSGFPFTATYPGGVLNIGSTTGTGDRPNVITNPNYPGGGTIRNWFNTSAFQAPPSYVWGNEGKNILRGPNFTNLDLAVQKRVVLPWERHTLTFRMEGNNLFNHVELGLPNASFGTATFGQITTLAGNPRTLQAALRYEF